MPHFKAPDNSLHFLDAADIVRGEIRDDDGNVTGNSVLALLPPGCVQITDAEAEALRNPIDKVRADVWERIKAERDRRTQLGGFPAAGGWFHSDTFSRSQQLGLVLMGAGMPADIKWKTMGGAFVDMTPALAQQILSAGAAQDNATFHAAEAHRAAMEASADPAAYDFSGGWPPAFGES